MKRLVLTVAILIGLAAPGWGQSDAGYEAYKRGDYAAAHRIWKSLADRGDASAQYNLGLLYHHGLGVKRQLAVAAKWYGRAAENGDADAQKAIGDLYVEGFWGKKDYAKAATWYRKAAEQGHAEAQKSLRKLEGKHQIKPRQATSSQADFQTGVAAYKRGDYAAALRNFRPLAEQGERKAQYWLGRFHAKGLGVPRDYTEAAKWYRRAANQGHAGAQHGLGMLYQEGRGVPRDYVQAYKWFSLSVSRWPASMRYQAPAIKNRNKISKKMTPAQIARAEELVREWRPSKLRAKDQSRARVKKDFDAGVAAAKRGDNDTAIHYFSRAIESGELSQGLLAFAFHNRGIAYSNKGLNDRAIKDSSRAIQLRARFFWAYISRAGAYRASRRFQLALNDIETAKRLSPSMPVFYHLGWTLHDMGHYDRAIEAYNSGLRFQPDYWAAYYRRGLSYEATGDLQRAHTDFKKSYTLSPDEPDIQNKMRELGLLGQADPTQADSQVGLAAYKRGDYAAALREWKPLAEQGHSDAQAGLGTLYEDGKGVSRDYAEAARWYRKAAEQGHAGAQHNLGLLYGKGLGVQKDLAEAFRWLRKAAEKGDVRAQINVGLTYENGRGVAQNYAEAAKWYRRAAERGHATAQNFLGNMYSNGRGVPQNYAEAAKWYRKAAERGHVKAQNSLGIRYALGKGVPQDLVQAYKWLDLAASGWSPGQERDKIVKNRDITAEKMTPAQIGEAERLVREWKPKK